ncbi:hypothetical protein R1flu_024383 [Riccia fluitans]|uniref:Histone deacetylase interacting domain-containing protein n=1 Tax=Riccia fluitans TaxID=41844 RepID=A0ABD1XXN3_9MARC
MKRKRVEEAPMRLAKRVVSDHDDAVMAEARVARTDGDRPRADRQNGVAFLKMVKETLRDEVEKYDAFVKVMQNFKRGLIGTREVIRRVKMLFKKHPSLIMGFNIFLQPSDQIDVPAQEGMVDVEKLKVALKFVNKEEYPARDNSKYEQTGAQEEHHTSAAAPTEKVTTDVTEVSLRVPRKAGADMEKAAANTSVRVPRKADMARGAKKRDKLESNGAKSGGVGQDQENGQEKVRRKRAKRAVLAPPEPTVEPKRRRRRSKAKEADESEQLAFFESVSKDLEGTPVYKELFQSMNLCRRQIVTSSQLHKLVSDVLRGHPQHRKAFHRCFPNDNNDSDLILKRWQTCTPSYQLDESILSENPAVSTDSERETEGGRPYSTRKILNKTWVTITTGGNACTSQESNRYEEVLFQCEDDQYELDMLTETTRSTARKLSECIEMWKNDTHFDLDEHLGPVHLRCIERIYNPIYPTLLAHARDSPGTVLPVVLSRLEQRLEDWVSTRTELNPLWARVRAANHSKSLVYESDLEMGEDGNEDGAHVQAEEEDVLEDDWDDEDDYTVEDGEEVPTQVGAQDPKEDGQEFSAEDEAQLAAENPPQVGDELKEAQDTTQSENDAER